MTTHLVHCVMYEYDGNCEPFGTFEFPLIPGFELEELREVPGGTSQETVAEVGLGFILHHKDEGCIASISASFRLVFASKTSPTAEERNAIVCDRALREAWPVFRGHLNRVLAEMGLPLFHGTHQVLPEMLEIAPQVLARTAEVDARLAADQSEETSLQ